MIGDVVHDVSALVEGVVSARIGELETRIEALVSGVREERALLVDAINAHAAATREQTGVLEAVRSGIDAVKERVDVLCSHAARLANVGSDVAAVSSAIQRVATKADGVSSDVACLKARVNDVSLVFDQKVSAIRTYGPSFGVHDAETMWSGVNALKQWTGKASAAIVFDSAVDPFTHAGLFSKVRGKPNIAVIGFTTVGDVFGGFYSVAVTQQDQYILDRNIFAFSFESRGRCTTPQRFVVKRGLEDTASVNFFGTHTYGFVCFSVSRCGNFYLGDVASTSICWSNSSCFEGVQDTTLSGQSGGNDGPFHHCTRLVAVQLL